MKEPISDLDIDDNNRKDGIYSMPKSRFAHFSYEDRQRLNSLLNENLSFRKIALILGCSQTIIPDGVQTIGTRAFDGVTFPGKSFVYDGQPHTIKVANVPLVPELEPPEELFKVPPYKVVGLLIDPYKLNDIRSARLKIMGLDNSAEYADMKRIGEELEYAKGIMRRIHCPIINVSNRAIEETAGIIMDYHRRNLEREKMNKE